jgi:predicted RNase H-related nuclease YkuK (DUF458 family)
METESAVFHRWSGENLSLPQVIEHIAAWIAHAPERHYKVIVGTDSSTRERMASLVSAITAWRVGNGAIHFWTVSAERAYAALRERIWDEALHSITLAQEVRARLTDALGDDFFWDGNEIHVDIGRAGATRELIEGITGMIRGYHFEPVIKPDAFGASTVADRHT